MAKISFLLGEYTEEENVYHFGFRGKCYFITLKEKDDPEKNIYESSNMNEAYAKWRDIKGSKGKNCSRTSRPQNNRKQ